MREKIRNKIERFLSEEYYCPPSDFGKKETVYSVAAGQPEPYIKIMAYRECIVVCTSEDMQARIRKVLREKNRDEIFELPFVYGQTIHYVPDEKCEKVLSEPPGYTSRLLFGEEILALKGTAGFDNSLSFDEKGHTSAKAVCIAEYARKTAGIAGAAPTQTYGVWEIGIDVAPEFRKAGLGSYLVSSLTRELLARDIVPFYSASVTNIGSQMVANRSGYIPLWTDTYGNVFDEDYAYGDAVRNRMFEE